MSFFNELKRRNVIRVGFAYIVVAWLIMQFADVVLNNNARWVTSYPPYGGFDELF